MNFTHRESSLNLQVVWGVLLPLTLGSYLFAEKMNSVSTVNAIVLLLALVKIWMILSEFMELRRRSSGILVFTFGFFLVMVTSLILLRLN
ncbi:hypothetical protein COW36_19230 [bacterium (Candidatus Blackallbacteria) CG17_big_fil_post_rev_8_21_14_2_50_48_46]|uniref:Cytochrome C oxidase subunit IV n=1 Tax=bacterium (Candidatus Blackallbacteria) CG17_big_fil_post_rev_8_21_14_2_50_48_46 TaxID=2014261 RepID=A0A2M7G0A0_9BACT|nr:MAG: hypothetical protein COW64_25240 [bacterium (Candidatus Blackallbacteria) CG18_big_fil_WC_8_21_14_2_50_49_26]PIW15057.1 MAG: hypothetical protein COW36_19230 [bacterium (Candidatus Blackallbacteria) CG17_big_fil_post_rev_8_21_14_2_50_48_46]PIW47620.1 MAG: hypothetical protein COW20_12090 [bacterium (Candidatus Blackallbacteria) CG13_big_fil_rev_8_21_14_2_50_49_14]